LLKTLQELGPQKSNAATKLPTSFTSKDHLQRLSAAGVERPWQRRFHLSSPRNGALEAGLIQRARL
jgi:hypothetical protein